VSKSKRQPEVRKDRPRDVPGGQTAAGSREVTGAQNTGPGRREATGGRGATPERRTVIAPAAVAGVAGAAARSVRGVHDLGSTGGAGGALDRVRTALPGGDEPSTGVQVELGEVQAAVDLSLVAEYGVPVAELAGDVRERVVRDVEELAGFEVTEVNIAVVDVHLDEEDEA